MLFFTFFALVQASWKSMISQVDTGMHKASLGLANRLIGRVYMYENGKYYSGNIGPVCLGNGNYKLTKRLGHRVCKDNGYRSAEFFGTFKQYEKFIAKKYRRHTKRGDRKKIKNYLLHVHRHHDHEGRSLESTLFNTRSYIEK